MLTRKLCLSTLLLLGLTTTVIASGYSTGAAFRHYSHIAGCGTPISGVTWEANHAYQKFQRCTLRATYQTVGPTRTPTPRPTVTPLPSNTATPLPSNTVTPLPTPTAWTWPTPIPTATQPIATDPVQRALQLINEHRAEYGLPPLSLNVTQSSNSAGHAQAMAETGSIWHVNPNYPQYSFPQNIIVPYSSAGENVGMAGSVDQVDALMWSEPHYAGCSGNHACNMIGAQYMSVGIGVYFSGGYAWYVTDFVG